MPGVLITAVSSTVKQLRSESKLSQEDLAFRAGLDRTYISGIERGVRNISLVSLEQLVSGLGISLPAFLNLLASNVVGQAELELDHDD